MTTGIGNEIGRWCPSLDDSGNGTTTLNDLIASNDGTLTNMDASTDWVADTGSDGVRALDFDGSNDIVLFGDVLDQATNSFTASVWIKAAAGANGLTSVATAGGRVFQKRGTGSVNDFGGWQFCVYRSFSNVKVTNTYVIGDTGSTSFLNGDNITVGSTGAWIHLAFVIDRTGNTAKIYANATEVASKSISGIGDLSSDRELTLGGSDVSATQYYKGLIDDAVLFNKALSSAEVTTLFNNGRGYQVSATSNAKPSIQMHAEAGIL